LFGALYWVLARALEERDQAVVERRAAVLARAYAGGQLSALVDRLNGSVAQDGDAWFVRVIDQHDGPIWVKAPPDWVQTVVQRIPIPEWGVLRNVRSPPCACRGTRCGTMRSAIAGLIIFFFSRAWQTIGSQPKHKSMKKNAMRSPLKVALYIAIVLAYPVFGGRLLHVAPCVVRHGSRVPLQFGSKMNKRHTNLWEPKIKSKRATTPRFDKGRSREESAQMGWPNIWKNARRVESASSSRNGNAALRAEIVGLILPRTFFTR
jgi:hypothetical protein